MSGEISGKTAIVGIGETDYSRNSGRTELVLSLQAITAALDDCGIKASEVDGLLRWGVETTLESDVASNLGIKDLALFGDIMQGGNVGAALIAHASAAIAAGQANVVVIYRGLNGRSGRRYGRGEVRGWVSRGVEQFNEPYGMLTPQHRLAMMTRRRMYETGTTSEQFGHVAVAIRSHANRNPRAIFYETPLTLEDHQNSRLIVDPLHLFDCCLETDGAGAIVVTSAERARHLKRLPAYIAGAAQSGPGAERGYTDVAAKSTGPRLWRSAGLGPQDVDVVQIYDHFSPYVIFALEDYGFFARGEGGPFVESGGISWPDGKLPVNTSGGHLSEAYLQGMNQILEGVRQIRGTSTAQVKDANVSFVDTGVGTGAVLLTRERN